MEYHFNASKVVRSMNALEQVGWSMAYWFLLGTLGVLLFYRARGDNLEDKKPLLFVFGDSYADTGNHSPDIAVLNKPWKKPYGKTWPGEPSGRYSDGRVFTDFVASHFGLPQPVPYRVLEEEEEEEKGKGGDDVVAGVNFAYGGSGVFETFGPLIPRVSDQIQQLSRLLLLLRPCPPLLLASSLVLFVVAGNDYLAYQNQHGAQGILEFVPKVVVEIVKSLQSLYDLGFRTFLVTNMAPYGCCPEITKENNYHFCNNSRNARTVLHNKLLANHIAELKRLDGVRFIELDFEKAFHTISTSLHMHGFSLRPCCEGIEKSDCGDVDLLGRPQYAMCKFAGESLFWDDVHPTDAGWNAIYHALISSLCT